MHSLRRLTRLLGGPQMNRRFRLSESLVDGDHDALDVGPRDDQGRRDRQDALQSRHRRHVLAHDHAALEHVRDDPVDLRRRQRIASSRLDEFEAPEQTPATHVPHDVVLRFQLLQTGAEECPHPRRVLNESTLRDDR